MNGHTQTNGVAKGAQHDAGAPDKGHSLALRGTKRAVERVGKEDGSVTMVSQVVPGICYLTDVLIPILLRPKLITIWLHDFVAYQIDCVRTAMVREAERSDYGFD